MQNLRHKLISSSLSLISFIVCGSVLASTSTTTMKAITSTQNSNTTKNVTSTATKAATTSVITSTTGKTTINKPPTSPGTAYKAPEVSKTSSELKGTNLSGGKIVKQTSVESGNVSVKTVNGSGPTDSGNYISLTPTGQ